MWQLFIYFDNFAMIYCTSTTTIVATQINSFMKLPICCILLVAKVCYIQSTYISNHIICLSVADLNSQPSFKDQTFIGKHNVLVLHSLLVPGVFDL